MRSSRYRFLLCAASSLVFAAPAFAQDAPQGAVEADIGSNDIVETVGR